MKKAVDEYYNNMEKYIAYERAHHTHLLCALVMALMALLDVIYYWAKTPAWLFWTEVLLCLVFAALGIKARNKMNEYERLL